MLFAFKQGEPCNGIAQSDMQPDPELLLSKPSRPQIVISTNYMVKLYHIRNDHLSRKVNEYHSRDTIEG